MAPWDVQWTGDAPILVFDDDCGFCTWWARYVARHSEIDLVGFSELSPELEAVLPEDYERSSHLVTEDRVYSGGESMEEALVRTDRARPFGDVVEFLRAFEDYERLREHVYGWVTENRALLGRVTSDEPPARSGRDRTD